MVEMVGICQVMWFVCITLDGMGGWDEQGQDEES
jgi:hypothetical protein